MRTAMRAFFSERGGTLDPIMAIDELFRNDSARDKINLVVGVFQNNEGETPVLRCVKEAEAQLLGSEQSKAYLPIPGDPTFLRFAENLVLGAQDGKSGERDVASVQVPGSTAALFLAAEFIKAQSPKAKVWLSTPAYSNHKPIFNTAGLGT